MGSLEDRIAALELRADALGSSDLALRSLLQQLGAETLRSRRAATDADVAAMGARLGPGSLTGSHGLRGASFDRTPDLGSPLLARLRDDNMLAGTVAGRTDTFAGYANALADPTFERMSPDGTNIGTAYTALGSAWEAKYVLNSGTVATTRSIYRAGLRADSSVFTLASSALAGVHVVFGTNASDMTIYLRPVEPFNILTGLDLQPSWLVGSVRIWATTVDNLTATAYLEIVDSSDTVLAAGDDVDLGELNSVLDQGRLEAAYEGPEINADYRWRLRIDVTKTAGSAATLIAALVEPLVSGSEDGSVPSFTPAVGAWMPAFSGARYYRATDQSVADVTDEDLVFNVGAGSGTLVYDTDAYHDDANAGRFTAPVDGVYHVDVSVEWAANATGQRWLWLEKNGAGGDWGRDNELNPLGGVTALCQISADINIDAGDYLTARVRQNSTAARNILSGRNSFFNIRLVGVGQW